MVKSRDRNAGRIHSVMIDNSNFEMVEEFQKQRLTAVGTRRANHVTPLYPQKLALTSPTDDGRSVGIVRSRTKATEFSLVRRV